MDTRPTATVLDSSTCDRPLVRQLPPFTIYLSLVPGNLLGSRNDFSAGHVLFTGQTCYSIFPDLISWNLRLSFVQSLSPSNLFVFQLINRSIAPVVCYIDLTLLYILTYQYIVMWNTGSTRNEKEELSAKSAGCGNLQIFLNFRIYFYFTFIKGHIVSGICFERK